MSEARLIKNRFELERQGLLVSLVERLICSLGFTDCASVEWNDGQLPRGQAGVWLVAMQEVGCGFGICIDDLDGLCTPIRRWVECARYAQRLAQLLARSEGLPAVISQRDSPPVDWREVQVRARDRLIRCAVSRKLPGLQEPIGPTLPRNGVVRVSLTGSVLVSGTISQGSEYALRSIQVVARGIKLSGRLSVGNGGEVYLVQDMSDEITCGDNSIPVCLDLGEIELDLRDIATMRRGSVLEVDAPGGLRCYMRVGNSIVAEGSVESSDDGFTLRIDRVVAPQ